jgi:UTP--glucose-1-phosphate uridylyltransferase
VLFGDGVIYNEGTPAIKQLIDAYGAFGEGVLGVKKVPEEDIHKYGSLKVESIGENVFKCTDMVEKPQTKEEVLSLYSITDRVVLPPSIFEILERTQPGVGGEIQLTDAMKEIATTKGMTAVEMEGKRFDMGNKFGVLQANIEVGLVHPETKEQLKDYIKELAKSL